MKRPERPSPPPVSPSSPQHKKQRMPDPDETLDARDHVKLNGHPSPSKLHRTATPSRHDALPVVGINGLLNHTPAKENGNADDSGDWNKVEKRKLKKQRNQVLKMEANPAVFKYLVSGLKNRRDPVSIDNVRDFVISLLADVPPQPWIVAENPRSITHVVTLLVPGILPSHIGTKPSSAPSAAMPLELPRVPLAPPDETLLPILHTLFSHACPTKAPGETNRMHSVLAQLLQCPLTGDEQKRQQQKRIEMDRQQTISPSDFVLSYADMKENDYPLPTYLRPAGRPSLSSPGTPSTESTLEDGWVETPQSVSEPPKYSLLAIDCEMCLTADGQELARIAVVDAISNQEIYDTMVMPSLPVLNYQTKYSGVTELKLEGVTTKLADVQQVLLSILHPSTILLGHSLENDLRALKLAHPRCADTSVLFHHPRGAPYKPGLKWLANKWLQKEIQKGDGIEGEAGGHDPEEDARACIDLFNLKLSKGHGFGQFQQDIESIFEKLARPSSRRPAGATAAVVDYGNPASWHGAKAKTAVACKTDEEVLNGIVDVVQDHDFVFARFMELSNASGWTTQKTNTAFPMSNVDRCASPPDHPASSEDSVKAAFLDLNDRIARLHRLLPRSTAIVLLTGHGDPRRMVELNARRNHWDQQWKKLQDMKKIAPEDYWTTEDDRKLALAVERAKIGLAFFCITRQAPASRPANT